MMAGPKFECREQIAFRFVEAAMSRRRMLPLILAALGGCVSAGPPEPFAAAATPAFDPAAFFRGATHGTGNLRVMLRKARTTEVTGQGTVDRQGDITLHQRVVIAGARPAERTWHLRRTGPASYAGTLTDASGPVAAVMAGNVLTIRYPMKHGLRVAQRLVLQPGGAAVNTMVVRKWGVVVARLDERIEKTR
jgi:hypothetical protein